MEESNVSWSRSSNVVSVDPNEKLFLFGYSCKIFRDDEKSTYIDQGKHLIPWMGDKSLMIDRYDVRGYLHDLKLYEPKSEEYEDPLSEEENMCDEERYRSLRSDMSEEQLYQEEELKRLRAAIASDGAYHEIAFTYDNTDQNVEPEASKVEEPEDELYQAPEGLIVPKGMEVPYTMKIHAIIEKTAIFVSEQGGQMEIIIKMKQQGNPQFAFMHLDNPLYPYYKHLVKVIKSGAYKPIPARKVSRSEDEDDDGHYLHPSLMSGRQEPVPKFTVPTINFRRSHDDSYSVLVRNLQQHKKEEASPLPEQNSNEGSENTSSDEQNCELKSSTNASVQQIVHPPPDIQPIIDKMAEYVAKNGEDFETIVKSKNDKRFDFLHPWHEYHNYYINKRNLIKASMQSQSSSHTRIAFNDSTTQNIPYQYQPKPIVQESGPVLYKNGQPASQKAEQSKQSTKPSNPVVAAAAVPVKDEHVALYSQDSPEAVSEPPFRSVEGLKDDTSNSMDILDSPKTDKSSEEELKSKSAKVLKGPISFSLKAKETDVPTENAKLTLLLMDDSEDESTDESKTEKEESTKRKKSVDESFQTNVPKSNSAEAEVKTPKQNNEVIEAKQAEERIKDKLLSAARERLAQQRKEKQMLLEQQKREEQQKIEKQQLLDQQRKEKQLQLERKRKAELFLKMLKKKNPDSSAVVSHILASDKSSSGPKPSDFWSLPDTSTIGPPTDSGILFGGNKMLLTTGLLGVKTDWSSDSVSEHSGEEEPISVIGEKLSSEEPDAPEEATVTKTEKKKKKRKHSSRSRSRERSRSKKSKTLRRSREKRRSHSRSRKQEKKKEKQLPAAYALSTRSRSRSPRRYRPSFNHWNRRR